MNQPAPTVRPTPQPEISGAEIGSLSFVFARLYQSPADSQRVVTDAGLGFIVARVMLQERPLTRWFDILVELRTRDELDAILAIAVHDNAGEAELRRAIEQSRRPAPADMQELVEPHPAATVGVWGRAASPGPARPLVGRTDLVVQLRRELEATQRGPGGSHRLLIGLSGVGKSRLAEEALGIADTLGMGVLVAQCVGQHAEPLKPLRECLERYRGEVPVHDLLSGADPNLADYVPFLERFLGVGGPSRVESPLGGTAAGGVLDGLARVMIGLARRSGLCLLVEDLTDADPDTLAFVEYLDRQRGASRVVTLTTVKGDLASSQLIDRIQAWQLGGCSVTKVLPFSRVDTAAFIALLRGPATEDRLVDEIYTQTGGNALFIEQYVSLAAESGTHDGVPDKVEEVLVRRLDRVAAEAPDLRAFLNAAAVALEVSQRGELVAEVGHIGADPAARLLGDAIQQGYLTSSPSGEIAFAQRVLQRVIVEGLPDDTRRGLHVAAAMWLEAQGLHASASHHYLAADREEDMVRTALLGAREAVSSGAYATALRLFEVARPSNPVDIGLELAKINLILGAWPEVDRVLDSLPMDFGPARVERSKLYFVRVAYDRSMREFRLASQSPSVDSAFVLARLADTNLYLGRLGEAKQLATEALGRTTDPTLRADCLAVIGTSEYHLGDIDAAQECYLREVQALPEKVEDRDRFAYTVALHNLALAREIRGDWQGARRFHEEALRLRLEVSAAREIGHSRHSLVRCAIGQGDYATARQLLAEARNGAQSLNKELELAKLDHTDATIRLATGSPPVEAVKLVEGALDRFRRLGVAYDVAHATVTLSGAYAAAGESRRAVEEGASARTQLERGHYRLLTRLFPDVAFEYRDRIVAGYLGYAAGDAVGLPWENMPAAEIDTHALPSLHATANWPAGATSDDTALTLLVGEHLAAGQRADGLGFLARLAAVVPTIPGLGPSTTAAIEAYRETNERPTSGGNTNGALMRSLPVGWALGIDHVEDRRAWIAELSAATHPGAEAITAASVGAAVAAWAIEGSPATLLVQIAREEAEAITTARHADRRIVDGLAALAAGTWQPDAAADTLDPYQTLLRVMACVAAGRPLDDAMLDAVRFGGDTDTVAALVGGLLGCQRPSEAVRAEVPWLSKIQVPDADCVATIADGLATLRVTRVVG